MDLKWVLTSDDMILNTFLYAYFAICIFSLVKYMFQLFIHFSKMIIHPFITESLEFLIYSGFESLSDMCCEYFPLVYGFSIYFLSIF